MIFEKYEKHLHYLLWFPILLLIFSVALLSYNQITTGSFMQRDVDLTGGKMIVAEISGQVDIGSVQNLLPDARIRLTQGVSRNLIVEVPFESNESDVISKIETVVSVESFSVRSVGPALGNLFFQQTIMALIGSFIAMTIIVFILFRSLAPSSIVVFAAATDIIGTLGVLALFGIPLSLPVLAGLLMLIGYSVDTDILLTTTMTKEEKEFGEKTKMAIKTGLTMTLTALAALAAIYFISGSFVLEQIAMVLGIGLLIDMPATWFTNAGIMQKWVKRRAA